MNNFLVNVLKIIEIIYRRNSTANAINDHGQIVGYITFGDFIHATLWENETFTDLGTLDGFDTSNAADINILGQIVGNSAIREGNIAHGVTWIDGEIIDLNDKVHLDDEWLLENAVGIRLFPLFPAK
ncbi:hypothetical protein ACFLV7_11260 [Chloroflexota bacterium]